MIFEVFKEDGERKKLALGYIEEENSNGNFIVRFGGPITDCTDPTNRIKLSPSRSSVFSPYPARFEIFDSNILKPYPKIKDDIISQITGWRTCKMIPGTF